MTAATLIRYLPMNPSKHGRLLHVRTDAKGEAHKDVKTYEPGPVTLELVQEHLSGAKRFIALGYLPAEGDATPVGMIDLDAKDFRPPDTEDDESLKAGTDRGTLEHARLRLIDVAEALGWHVYFEESTRGGWHVFVFTDEALPFALMCQALKAWAQRAGLGGVEVYPMGDDHLSRWYIMPYAGAASDLQRLGRTFLTTADLEPIPFDELDDWIERTPAEKVQALAGEYQEPTTETSTATEPADLAPEALALLKEVALHPPDSFNRHDTMRALMNLAKRCSREAEMIEHLKSEKVRNAWVKDGSRDARAWANEIDRWAKAKASAHERGIPYLVTQGFKVPDLPKISQAETGRRTIQVNGRWLRDISDDSLKALEAVNHPPFLFMRGTVPARVDHEAKVEALTNAALKGVLDRAADFVKVTTKLDEETGKPVEERTPARPPSDLAPDLLALSHLPFPRLEGIATVPVFLPGGTLLAANGYDPDSGILLRLSGLEGLHADMPADEALGLLDEVYADFPFAEPEPGRAHALALTLQPFVRYLIRGATPLYLIDAPARGTGKGLLAEVAVLIPLGYVVPVMSQPRDGDELEKRITAALLDGRPTCFFDNVTELKSAHLAAALTAEVWQGRILGKSEIVTLPNRAVWLATGNNVDVSDEFARRIIPIRLDAGVERPEERRGFKHAHLPSWVGKHRANLVSACLSLIQAWIGAGSPAGEALLGRYESWAAVMGGILGVSGVSGFLGGRERLHAEADSETREWAAFCEAWWQRYEARPVAARDLFEVAKERTLLLNLWGGRNALGAQQRLGHALAMRRDRVFGGYAIRRAGDDSHTGNAAYRLERGQTKTPETPETTGATTESTSQPDFSSPMPSVVSLGVSSKATANTGGTTVKQRHNNGGENAVQEGVVKGEPGVTGVSVVSGRPAAQDANRWEDDTDYAHLIGAMEGEL